MKGFSLCILNIILFLSLGSAQSTLQLLSLGDDAYSKMNYFTAIQFYQKTLETDKELIDVRFRLAESYRNLYNYTEAEKEYFIVYQSDKSDKFPEACFLTALMMKSNGKYQDAIALFQQFLQKGNFTSALYSQTRANLEIQACNIALDMIAHPVQANIQPIQVLNTQYSEFNAVPFKDDGIVFSSLRPVSSNSNPIFEYTGAKSSLFYSKSGLVTLQEPKIFSTVLNSKDQHTANISFSKDYRKAYFNKCYYLENKLKCDVWKSELQDDNQWGKPVKLEAINSDKYTTTQPFITNDIQSGNDILYFSSDREGGFGGLDLWFSVIKDNIPQTPVNLGSIINTPGDEITPFYQSDKGILYFSSDWHSGLGGFDIFYSKGGLSKWDIPKNIGYPVNSGANDLYFFLDEEQTAYLTSNRSGTLTFKEQTCCNDIFIADFSESPVSNIEIKIDEQVKDSIQPTIKNDILELLPLSLYFDNDQPNPRTVATSTNLSYKTTYESFSNKKQIFIKEYSKGLQGVKKELAEKEMERFFEEEVSGGMQKLDIFTDLIYQDLLSGSNITLKVKGFTSPLNTAEYNFALAKRRISSLQNYFMNFQNGILVPYIQKTAKNGASLSLLEESAGEVLAAPFVSDNAQDRQQSVYSIAASKERKIQIFIYEAEKRQFSSENVNAPAIYIADNLIQLQKYLGSNNVVLNIEVKNIGKSDLTINTIESPDKKISIITTPKILLPQEKGIISVRIDEIINQTFNSYIIIHSNSNERRNVVYFTALKK